MTKACCSATWGRNQTSADGKLREARVRPFSFVMRTPYTIIFEPTLPIDFRLRAASGQERSRFTGQPVRTVTFGKARTYVYSNFFSNFWIIVGKL